MTKNVSSIENDDSLARLFLDSVNIETSSLSAIKEKGGRKGNIRINEVLLVNSMYQG